MSRSSTYVSPSLSDVCTGILVNGNRISIGIKFSGNNSVLVSNNVVPVSVEQEVGRQGNLLRESKGIGGQFVERKSSGVLDDDSCTLYVGILGLTW